MSGDVQPRKRKDKKRKKDELGVEEPRGTAAVFGEGDVFMHSQHEHGTGGHWCAKIIFFSLLAVLITLIGLIILENRGLTELEANSVESRYSGVLEGWLEDAHDDDHHDEHTLELKHHGNVPHDDLSQEIDEDDDHDNDDVLDDDQLVDDHQNDDDDLEDQDEDDEIQRDSQENDDEEEDDDEERASEEDDDDDQEEVSQEDDNDDDEQDRDSQENDDDEQDRGSPEDDDDDDIEPNIQEDDLGRHDEDELFQNKYYDDDQDDISQEIEHPEEPQDQNDSQENLEDSNEQDEDIENGEEYRYYKESEERQYNAGNNNGEDSFEDLQRHDIDSVENNDDTYDQSVENNDRHYDDENKLDDNDEDEEHEEEAKEDSGIEVEKLEKEVTDDLEQASVEEDVLDHDDKSEDVSAQEDDTDLAEDDEFLEADDVDDLPVVEHIVAPKGKPFVEVEEEPTTVKPANTLADEEEYEKQQEQLRREQEQASHMWLKLVVGGALLVATHAVVRRATATRDDASSEEHEIREETPSAIDRRMTLIRPEPIATAPPKEALEQKVMPVVKESIFEKVSPTVKSAAPIKNRYDDESEDEQPKSKEDKQAEVIKYIEQDKELYSDDEEAEDEEIIEEENVEEIPQDKTKTLDTEVEESEIPDDVEIIDEEQLEEELEDEEEEEDISDVDDAELLNRLEAKYGRLPEPERPERKHKDGGNSIDDWPGEPSDQYWRQQLDQAEEELRQGDWSAASQRLSSDKLRASGRAKWLSARAIDVSAEQQRDNRLLSQAINAYLEVLKMNERLSDARLLQVTERILDRMRFRGNYLSAEPVYRLLIRRFPDVVDYRNNLTVSFLMANRADLAEDVIRETLKKWPGDRFALAHLGFVLKTKDNKLEEAVEAFEKALEGDIGPATEPRFYYHLGDSLLLLGRFSEAHEVHKRGAAHGHFLSPAQRSLYNVDRLKSQPWWDVNKTPYAKLARALEKSWKEILKEGEAARALYEMEKEGLKERGEWSQLDLFARGREVPERCARAPVTCSIVRTEAAAAGCRRGQVKFSSMKAGTHVRPHVGPTNCRLRMHLGLSNTKDTYIRVDQEIRQWQVGKVLMFDDSFEHEVWHNGTGTRLVLIVDVWHPALTPHERRTLPPI